MLLVGLGFGGAPLGLGGGSIAGPPALLLIDTFQLTGGFRVLVV